MKLADTAAMYHRRSLEGHRRVPVEFVSREEWSRRNDVAGQIMFASRACFLPPVVSSDGPVDPRRYTAHMSQTRAQALQKGFEAHPQWFDVRVSNRPDGHAYVSVLYLFESL